MTKEAVKELQGILRDRGFYAPPLVVDGLYGQGTRNAIMAVLCAGARVSATKADFAAAGKAIGVGGAEIRAVWIVEASGKPYNADGSPVILFEPHRFWRSTQGRFPRSAVNYPKWGEQPYPRTQQERYAQLLTAVGLDVDAGFASASYGGPQILGENFKAAGFVSPFMFALGMSQGESAQIKAMIGFVTANYLDKALRSHDWAAFAKGYNGTAYRENKYDEKLAVAYAQAKQQGY